MSSINSDSGSPLRWLRSTSSASRSWKWRGVGRAGGPPGGARGGGRAAGSGGPRGGAWGFAPRARGLSRELVEQRDRLVARARGQDLALVAEPRTELGAQHAEHALLVVDAHDHFLAVGHAAASSLIGSRTSKQVRPGTESQRSSPPCL